jgi:hypothetical protein
MPELEYEDLNDILSHQYSYVELELGETLACALLGVGEDE